MPNFDSTKLSRRSLLAQAGTTALGAGLLAACAPVAAPAAPPAAPAPPAATRASWENEWDSLVIAAKREGKLALITYLGENFREAVKGFETAFPGITVEHTGLNSGQWVPRVQRERDAGLYNFDVMTSTWAIVPRAIAEKGGMAPIKQILFRGDVLDDNVWLGGFERGFLDKNEKWVYAGFIDRSEAVWINSDLVKEGEITKVEDLLDPKWKGKMISLDPRSQGGVIVNATVLRHAYGSDIIKRLWKDQEVVLMRDHRQMTEHLIRGRYAVGIGGVLRPVLQDFLNEGLGRNVKRVDMDNVDAVTGGVNIVGAFDRAPHPA
ncbi:MAG: extracellular solute-binding protein, partial [Chloroflexota bacterium]